MLLQTRAVCRGAAESLQLSENGQLSGSLKIAPIKVIEHQKRISDWCLHLFPGPGSMVCQDGYCMPPRVMNSDLGSSADQEHERGLSGVNGAF